MGKMKKRGKFCLSLLVLSLSFQSVFATSLVTASTMKEAANEIANEYTKENEMLDTFIKAESVTPSQLQLAKEIKSSKTTPAIMDVEANFTAIVRSGKFADKTASNGDSYMPRERLDAKTTKTDKDGHRKGYMMFSVPRDIDWDAINDVSLKLFVKERMGRDIEDTINFYITETPKVSEENMTWNNSPSIKEDRLAGKITLEQGSDITKNRWIDVDLTETIKNYCKQEQNSSSETNLSLTLCMSDPTPSDQGGVQFYSKYQDSGKYAPYLTLSTEGYKDTLPPKIVVTGLSGNQEVVEEALNFKVEAKDNHDNSPTVYISLNGTEQKGLLGKNEILLQEGKNLVQVIVRDEDGNEAKTEIYDINYFKGNTFTTVGDTFIRKDDSNKNFGVVKELMLKNPNSQGSDRRVYLNFDLGNYKKPYIREAKIYLYMNKIMGNDRTYQDVEIFETPTFDEKTLTWNNAPKDQEVYISKERIDRSKVSGSTSEVAVNAYYPLDITKYINSKLLKGEKLGTLSFALKAEPNDQTGWFIASKEAGKDKAPYINLVEGLPDPDLYVKGITENAIYSDDQIEDVEIKIGSVDSSIKLNLEAEINGKCIKLIPKKNGLYDIPLTQIGENTLKIKVTDEVGNVNVQTYHVTKLVYLETNTYYIDSIAGNDNYDGLSVDKPWKTLDKLNTLNFKPGTELLFKRGSVWNGQFKPKGSGTKDKPITVGSYGKGSRPILNGNGISSKETGTVFSEATVQLDGVSYWEVNDLEVTNKGYVAKGDTSVRRSGILVLSAGKGDINHIYIKNCYVHDINVDCATSRNYKPYNGGILFVGDTRDTLGNDTKVISGFNDVLVEDCHIKDVDIEGLRLVNRLNGGDQRNPKTNHDVVFRNNLIEETHGDGLVVSGVASGGLIEKNIIRRHSKCPVQLNYAGCWVIYSDGVVFQYNEVYDGVHGYKDGEAFDFDMGAPNTVFQYNYSHNNKGGFLLTMTTAGANNIFRYNISQNDGNGNEIFFCANKYDEAWIYNNTIYVGKGMQIPYLIEEDNLDYVNFKNNIVYAEGEIQNFSLVKKNYPGKFENNCIYPASILSLKGAPSNTKSNITVNPLLTDPSGTNIKMDTWDEAIWNENIAKFKLQPGSPCIDAGQKIPNAPEHDIYGTPLEKDGFIDIGAHEYVGEKILVESITLDKNEVAVKRAPSEGCEVQLKAVVMPAYAMNKHIEWSTSDVRIATVDQTGKVKGQSEGTATIMAKALDGSNKVAKCVVKVEAGNAKGPLLSFQVIADTHLDKSSITSPRAKELSNALKEMKKLDSNSAGVILIGDNTTNGTEEQYQGLDKVLNNPKYNPLPYYPLIGNHDVRWQPGGFEEAEARFKKYFNRDRVYYDEWFNGYHFIMLGTEKDLKDDAYISDQQWQWFEQKLAEHADPKTPIFVFLHQPLNVGFYESDAFNVGDRDLEMKHLLAKYPQVIYMSGHSHNAFGTKPGQKYDEKYCTMIDVPGFNASKEGYYVEVYEDKVIFKGRNFNTKKWIEKGQEGYYEISLPASIPATDLEEPTWPLGARLKVSLDGKGSANLKWTEAEDNVGVTQYRILRNGVPYAYVDGKTTTFIDEKLFKDSKYTFSVQAGDEECRWSKALVAEEIQTSKKAIKAGIASRFDQRLIDHMMAYIDFENNYVDQAGKLSPKLRRGTIHYEASPYGLGAKYDKTPEGLILGDIDYGNQDFTVAFWINAKASDYKGGPTIISNSRFSSRKNPGWVIAMTNGGKMWYNLAVPGGIQVDDEGKSGIVISNGEWQHVIISTDRIHKKATIYLNGEKKVVHDISVLGDTSLNTQFPTIVGKDGDGMNYGDFSFVIDELFMTKVAATDDEAQKMYQAYKQEPETQVEAIKLSDTSLKLTEKSTHQLLVEVTPEEAINKEVSFTSDNLEAVTVGPNGLISANKEGKAVITVRAIENDIKADCEITVIRQEESNEPKEENQASSSSGSKKKHKSKINTELKADSISKTVEEHWNKLDKNTKNQIQEKLNKELPYTLLEGSCDIKMLDELTQHQFTEKQLQAIQKDMGLLRELGLSTNCEVVALKPIEKASFKDIPPTYWANDAIQRLAKLGVVKGFEDGTFRPNEALRIEDTFSFLDRVLLLNGLTESTLSKDTIQKYITDKDNFAYHEKLSIGSKLQEATLKKVAQLKDESLSRGLVAEVLYEITNAKLDRVKELTTFKDIDTNEYKEALVYCFETGLLYGVSDELMSPDKDLTRAELMAILERLNILLSK